MLDLIVEINGKDQTICLVENGILVEKYQNDEKTKYSRLEGNIYSAKVADIIPGMQAAFIDYGDNKKGFIHYKDAVPQVCAESNVGNMIKSNEDITKVLKKDQRLLIQIKKDSNDKKGAKVSTHISLPSKYIVFMPNTEIITISQKIPEGKRREELIELAKNNISNQNGIVIRTSAESAQNEEIIKDIKMCEKKWNSIVQKYKKATGIALIHESETVQEKILIDLKVDNVVTNQKSEYEKINKLLIDEEMDNVKLEYKPNEELLNRYDLFSQIEKTKNKKIWLNCGGFITIDKTEALTAIDVNTGKYTGKSNLENTVFKVNKEATKEIAKQLKLRDIGGIIIIDYIDMKDEENKNKIENMLKDELKSDRAKTQVEGFTKLNLMELTRKHICSHLDEEN